MSRPITKDEPEDLSRLQQHIRAKKEAEKGEEIASGYYQDY